MLCCIAVSCLTVSCLLASCGSASNGKFLKMTNDTPVTVMMTLCTGNYAADQRCSASRKVAARGSADFSLPAKSAPLRMVRITGYGKQPLCFVVPPDTLPADAFADVTQVQPGGCLGFNGVAPSTSAG
jgi:hypothetical protein